MRLRGFTAVTGVRVGVGAACAIALVAGAALVAVPRLTWPNQGDAPTGPSRFASSGFAFDYPSSWRLTKVDIFLHYEAILAYVGTGTGAFSCASDYIPGGGCTSTESVSLPPNSVVVKVSSWSGPPTPKDDAVGYALTSEPQATALTVAGLPAVVRQVTPDTQGADLVLEWTLSMPGHPSGSYRLTAYLKGPDLTTSRSELDALISSVSFPSQ